MSEAVVGLSEQELAAIEARAEVVNQLAEDAVPPCERAWDDAYCSLPDDVGRLIAEVRRLRAADANHYNAFNAISDALTKALAERRRLREALSEISDLAMNGDQIERGPLGDVAWRALHVEPAAQRD